MARTETDLTSFAGALIDSTLQALIQSLESQVQWRQALDMAQAQAEALQNVEADPAETLQWIQEELDISLHGYLGKLSEVIENKDIISIEEDQNWLLLFSHLLKLAGRPFMPPLENEWDWNETRGLLEEIETARSERQLQQFRLLKEMGLPALVAEKVEISSTISVRAEVADESSQTPAPVFLKSLQPSGVSTSARESDQAAAKPRVAQKLTSAAAAELMMLEKESVKYTEMYEAIATNFPKSAGINLGVILEPDAGASDSSIQNAELKIILRSHFF